MLEAFHNTRIISLFVVPETDVSVYDGEQTRNNAGNQDGDEAWSVDRSVLRLEEKRTNEVACSFVRTHFHRRQHAGEGGLPRQYPTKIPELVTERFVYPAVFAICNPIVTAYPPPKLARI